MLGSSPSTVEEGTPFLAGVGWGKGVGMFSKVEVFVFESSAVKYLSTLCNAEDAAALASVLFA